MTTARSTKYEVGQLVEVEGFNFTKPGMPRAWFAGTVEAVVAVEGTRLFDVRVRMAEDGRLHAERISARGSERLRKAA